MTTLIDNRYAEVAQLVERHLAKVDVASSMSRVRVSSSAPMTKSGEVRRNILQYAEVAQLVERHLAKVDVASSSLVFRSIGTISSVGRAPDS